MPAQCPADLPSQMSSSTWPDSPRQLPEQSLTPSGVSRLPPPHPNPFTSIPAGFSSAPHSSGLQAQDLRLTSVGSLAGLHRLASNLHSLASDPKVLGLDFKLLGSGPMGVEPNPDTPSLEFQGAVPDHQHAQPALSGTESRQSLSLSEGSPKLPRLQSPFKGFAQTDSLPVVVSQGPRRSSFSSAHGAVPRQSPFDTRARPATQQSPFADAPMLRTLKASYGGAPNTEPHDISRHAGNSPKTGLIQSALQGCPNAGPASDGPQRHSNISPHPTALEGSFSLEPHAGTPRPSSDTEPSPGPLQSPTKAPAPPPSNAKPPHPPDMENTSASQPVRTASGGLTRMGSQQNGSGLHTSQMPSNAATASSPRRRSYEATASSPRRRSYEATASSPRRRSYEPQGSQRSASRLQYVTGRRVQPGDIVCSPCPTLFTVLCESIEPVRQHCMHTHSLTYRCTAQCMLITHEAGVMRAV